MQSQVSSEPRYRVGDLFWAKSPGHPWWPCMISSFPPPNNMSHIEKPNEHLGVMMGNNQMFCVVLCGTSLEYSWVADTNLIEYAGK
jgi:hypothetical protein